MQSSVGATKSSGGGSSLSMINQQFRRNFEIPLLPHQTAGIICRLLWPSKNQVIRIIPGHDPATGEVFPQNINCGQYSPEDSYDMHLSDTFYKATTVSRFGGLNYPIIADYAPGSEDEQAYAGETVLHNFTRSITYACNGMGKRRSRLQPIQEWRAWTGLGGTLSMDKQTLLMQALVFHLNGRDNQDGNGNPLTDEDGDILPLLAVVGIDNKLSIQNLCQALVEPANPGQPLNALTNNKYGGMAELDGNKLFLNTYMDSTTQRAALRPSVQAPGKGWTPTPFPLDAESAKQLWHPWEELLHYMTAEEQLKLCAQEFGADTVNYVIGTDPKFNRLKIPDEIKAAGFGRYASLLPGGSATLNSKSAQVVPGFTVGKPGTAPKPAGLKKAPGLTGMVDNGVVSPDVIRAEVARMRGASDAALDQSAAAKALLDDEDGNPL